ncbi:lipoprotein insertase outer membrane protein LolB [Aquicella lusitana]|uniref:Outer-membrane lipoprotein LolB n=1 Tax=Aquicella lusitana TaxID=254246 RepID=A0A370H3E5_9COXI|nr:lipoprotein insertase outer membrane protein LolB [Aquicella lusitana]RDI48603.1 outer membrane lipoprotein LolB [Aquicella lusitana]VVC74020.1 Outer-membrane lipoprotein LolB [Aquicella lusitana]
MRTLILLLSFCTFTFALVSCTTVTPTAPTPEIPWKNRELALSRIQSWQLSGKIAVQTARESGSATMNWTQQRERYQVALQGPLGAGSLRLSGQPGMASLETSDGKRYTANSAEQLLAQQSGWNLPLSHLKYWIRGLPVPGVSYQGQFDPYHRLSSLAQQGWNVQFLSYRQVGTVDLPDRLAITSPLVKSKIVIHQWNVNAVRNP